MSRATLNGQVWVPRVLKKRSTEFNVEQGEEHDAPAEPPPVTAKPATEFKGAADLDDLDEGEPAAKKAKADPAAGSSSGGPAGVPPPAPEPQSGVSAPPPAPKAEPPKDEIVEAAPKLAQHIANPSKFNKVAAMAWTLLDGGRVTSKNGGAFFTVLQAAVRDPSLLREKTYRVAYKKLFGAAIASPELFPPEARPVLKLWELHVLAQIDLYTDDSYQFSRAAKQVREALKGLPCVYPSLEPAGGTTHVPEEDRAAWGAALFDCVESAMEHHKCGA